MCSSGRGVPCTQVLATKLCGCQANIGYKASPWPEMKIPKADNTWDGHCPQKRLLMWEGFWSRPPISRYCPLWLMPHGFVQSHIRVLWWYTCVLGSSLWGTCGRRLSPMWDWTNSWRISQSGQYLLIGGRDEKPSNKNNRKIGKKKWCRRWCRLTEV